jgi:hypothetical protein
MSWYVTLGLGTLLGSLAMLLVVGLRGAADDWVCSRCKAKLESDGILTVADATLTDTRGRTEAR